MKKLRVAQIGTGHDHASAVFETLYGMRDRVEPVAWCIPEDDRNAFQGSRLSHYHDLPKLTPEEILQPGFVDAVTVETQDIRLTKYALMALEAGIPVHMDKPGAPDRASFAAMCDLAKKKELPLSVGYMYRFNPALQRLFGMLEAGELGRVLYVNAEMSGCEDAWKRAWLGDYPGGFMYFLGCHLVDLIYRLQGEPLEVVPLNTASGLEGIETTDCGFAAFRYERGTSFARATGAEHGGAMRRNIAVICEKGTFVLSPTEYLASTEPGASVDYLKTDFTLITDPAWRAVGKRETTPVYHRYDAMLRHFFDRVEGLEETVYTPDYEKKLHDLLLRACGH